MCSQERLFACYGANLPEQGVVTATTGRPLLQISDSYAMMTSMIRLLVLGAYVADLDLIQDDIVDTSHRGSPPGLSLVLWMSTMD